MKITSKRSNVRACLQYRELEETFTCDEIFTDEDSLSRSTYLACMAKADALQFTHYSSENDQMASEE